MGMTTSTVSIGETTKKSHYDNLLDNTIYLASATATLNGIKTFNDGIDSGGDGTVFKCKILEIGPWNMNSSASGTSIVNVAHGLVSGTIRHVSVVIRQDSDGFRYSLFWSQLASGPPSGYWYFDSTNIKIVAQPGNDFDDTNYDDISGDYNRGWVTIFHV